METSSEGGTGGGVAMGTDGVCMPVNECACTLLNEGLRRARRLLELSVLLWPLSVDGLCQRDERSCLVSMGEDKLKDTNDQ